MRIDWVSSIWLSYQSAGNSLRNLNEATKILRKRNRRKWLTATSCAKATNSYGVGLIGVQIKVLILAIERNPRTRSKCRPTATEQKPYTKDSTDAKNRSNRKFSKHYRGDDGPLRTMACE
ncbi:Uncharacterized protein Fot_33600 [Forsythia ovata]|uniref:Uncharacterized protein n=1 Tax=Forsythia ovata TaxID=205694 RepID=A0ABD1TB38_9LAMI